MDRPMPMAARSSTLRLPLDIIGEILSFFSNDQPTLLDCALVSQDWLFESRLLLLRNVDLFWKSADCFISNVLHSERLQPLLTSIHHLSFTKDESFIVDISERLPNLRTMAWGYKQYEDALRPDVFAAFAKFTRVRHLKLVYCTFASFHDVKKVVVALPALSSLTLIAMVWRDSADPDESLSTLAPTPILPTLSRLSVSTSYYGPRKPADDVLLWLSATPTRHLLRELSFDLRNIGAASQLMADTSLTTLDIGSHDDDELSEVVDAQSAQLQRLVSQVRHIGLLRFRFARPWDSVTRVLPLFGSVPSLHRLRLCSSWRFYYPQDSDEPEFGASTKQLGPILASSESEKAENAFRTLRAVEFAWYSDDGDEPLREQYTEFSAWVRRTLPQLHERCVVEVYAYNDKFVFGPTGLSEHLGGADFPLAKL